MPHNISNTTRAQGRRKSKFPAQTAVPAGSTFDYVVEGTNFKITFEDLLGSLNVTGTIIQVGDVLGTPILDTQGAVHGIRNLEVEPGIGAEISPENGITLTNRIIAGAGIAIGIAGEDLQITAIDSPTSDNTVTIAQASDFPAPIGGVITLVGGTDYFIIADVTVTDRFNIDALDIQIRSVAPVITELTYSGTDAMFTGEDVNFRLRNIRLNYDNGTLCNITSSTPAGIGVFSTFASVLVGGGVGIIGCDTMSIIQCGVVNTASGLSSGITTGAIFSVTDTQWVQVAGIGIDLGSTVFETVQATNMVIDIAAGTTFMSGLPNSGNIDINGTGLLGACRFQGNGTELAGLTSDDDLWEFQANNTIRDTIRDGILSVQGNATETVIAAVNTPVKVAGAFVVGRSSGFTPDTTGTITYDLLRPVVIPISASIALQMAAGGSAQITAYIAINGIINANSGIGTVVNSSGEGNITLTWQEEITKANTVEVWIENNDTTVNIVVVDMVLRAQ